MVTTTQRRFTVADLGNFPKDGKRYEVVDGEVYVTSVPHSDHQDVIEQFQAGLRAWDPERGRGWVLAGAGVIFSVEDGVIPDLVWVSADRASVVLVDPDTGTRDGTLHAAPDLAVEVLSPGAHQAQRDRETKLTLYSRRGVREYWIADRATQTVEVYRRGDHAQLALTVTLMAEDTLTSPLLPGFALSVVPIFSLPRWLPR